MGLESDEDEVRFLGFDHEGLDMFMKKCEFALANCIFFFKKMGFIPRKAEKSLRGMELHQKEAQKD